MPWTGVCQVIQYTTYMATGYRFSYSYTELFARVNMVVEDT